MINLSQVIVAILHKRSCNKVEDNWLKRDYHSVDLTAAGELFYKEMNGLISQVYEVIHRVQDIGAKNKSVITLGLLDGQEVESDVLFALRNMADRYPHLDLNIRRIPESNLVDLLKKGEIDIVETILPVDCVVEEGHEYYVMRKVRRYLVARKDDPIWEEEPSLARLDGKTLFTMEQRAVVTDDTKEVLQRAGIAPNYKTAHDTETLSLWLEAGMGYTIVNEGNVIYSSRTFRPLRVDPIPELPEVCTVLVWNNNHMSEELETFLTFIRSDMPRD